MMEFIAYYRVSTAKQERSGLGLEAQQEAVRRHIALSKGELLEEYTEIESGKKNDRPELDTALIACKKKKATLVIAKLDRLSRNLFFIAKLMEGKIDFVCCDNPNANKLMLHMLAAFAEHEREMISKRIKEALAAAKERGTELGKHGRDILAPINKKSAIDFSWSIKPEIESIKNAGFKTVRAIAAELNRRNIPTRKNARWHSTSVHRLLQKIE